VSWFEISLIGCMQVHIKCEDKTTKKKLADGWDKLAVNPTKSCEHCDVIMATSRLHKILPPILSFLRSRKMQISFKTFTKNLKVIHLAISNMRTFIATFYFHLI